MKSGLVNGVGSAALVIPLSLDICRSIMVSTTARRIFPKDPAEFLQWRRQTSSAHNGRRRYKPKIRVRDWKTFFVTK